MISPLERLLFPSVVKKVVFFAFERLFCISVWVSLESSKEERSRTDQEELEIPS